ncbi:MAG TPA: hypothetical protein VFN43_04270 [Humibacillus sp.]|nr:hypothetical protein [Humibacillus sp.]
MAAVPRGLAILGGVAIGVLLGFAVGLTTGQLIADGPGIDEAEYLGLILLGAFGGPLVGAVIGGVVAARLTRR